MKQNKKTNDVKSVDDLYDVSVGNSHRYVKKQQQKNNRPLMSPRMLATNPKYPWQMPTWKHWLQVEIEFAEISKKPLAQPDRYGTEPSFLNL
jgi:hypothetical protein